MSQFEFTLGKTAESQQFEGLLRPKTFLGSGMIRSRTRMAPFSAYVALVRGIAVDLGFGSLIEKFEERFGKPFTTGMLAIVSTGIIAGRIGLVVKNLILPGIGLYNNFDAPSFKAWAQRDLFPALVSLAVLIPVWQALAFLGFKIYDRTIGDKQRDKRLRALSDKFTSESFARAKPQLDAIQKEAADALHATAVELRIEGREFMERKQRELLALGEEVEARSQLVEEGRELVRSMIETIRAAIDPNDPAATKEELKKLQTLLARKAPADPDDDPTTKK